MAERDETKHRQSKNDPMKYFILFLSLAGICVAEPVDIGNRLELFADDFIVESMSDTLTRQLHQPEPKDVVFSADAPWEGNTSGYYTIFQDDDRIRMIYRGWAHVYGQLVKERHPEVTCYADSLDGLYFKKPDLGISEWNGSKANNIILQDQSSHNFAAFKDSNPDAPADAKYKGIGGEKRDGGLLVYKSADAKNWTQISEKPVISDGAFDSQNIAFFDPNIGKYRAYYRIFDKGGTDGAEWKPQGVRAIRTAISDDYINWEPGVDVTYVEGTPRQHLYTNAVQLYSRAPHIYIGFPTRYLPDEGQRVEPVFMISRDGLEFRRYNDPVIPESAPVDRAGNRSNYMTWGMAELPSEPGKISVYATEAYYGLEPGRIRRFVYRADGFVSVRAGENEGELITKPLKWTGDQLHINAAVGEGGSVRVELLDEDGTILAKSAPFTGDEVDAKIDWNDLKDLRSLQGKTFCVKIILKSADLYALQFR